MVVFNFQHLDLNSLIIYCTIENSLFIVIIFIKLPSLIQTILQDVCKCISLLQ